MKDNEIDTSIHYPIAPHKQLAFKEWDNESFPISEEIHNTAISIPNAPYLSNDDIENIVDKINKY